MSVCLLFLALILFPTVAFAHASPVEYIPAASAELEEAPREIHIRFSERLESGASRILVKDKAGSEVTSGPSVVSDADPHTLTVPLKEGEDGTYIVTWSVVSSDDGHFTKGAYAYAIGERIASVPQVEVVQSSALTEAIAIFVELLGNSLLWGALILFGFVARQESRFRYVYRSMVALGVALILLGAGGHLILKTLELARIQETGFLDALSVYASTVSGSATIGRAITALVFGAVFFLRKGTGVVSNGLLFLLLIGFAYLRAMVSHATANPFFPELSVLVNVIHLVGKDLWAGLLLILSVLLVVPALRADATRFLPGAFRIAILASLLVGPTATYIVWLHLKDFGNLSATLWGERFLPLLVAGILAMLLLAYHVIASRLRPAVFSRLLPYTLPAEAAVGIAIVFFSSLMIITSPPLSGGSKTQSVTDQGIHISLLAAPYEDGKGLLTVTGDTGTPIAFLDGSGEEQGILLELEERFPGGYVFPLALIVPGTEHRLSVTVPQQGGYDARATFEIESNDFIHEEERTLDAFTFIMMGIALLSILFSLALYRFSAKTYPLLARHTMLVYGIGFVVTLLVFAQLAGAVAFLFGNAFKRECIADGNAWHLMLPSRNGTPVSTTPAEGCMALGGSFHIPDAREYRYLKSPGDSIVVFENDLANLTPGVPTMLTFSIEDMEGKPALLSVVHERLAHMIVIGEDMHEFWHVHPEQTSPGSFTVPFTFPHNGTYLLALDYAHGLTATSKTFPITVGTPIPVEPTTYAGQIDEVDGYRVALDRSLVIAGEPATLVYRITKDGKDVMDLAPYLAAAMHLAVVKNDFSEFVHTHGEVHPPGTPIQPASKSIVHQHLPPPSAFGPVVEAHVIFPTSGRYTVFGEFLHEGVVVTTRFTVDVE